MNKKSINSRFVLQVAIATLLSLTCAQQASGQRDTLFESSAPDDGLHGYTEPFRSIELSSDETGAISKLLVSEGDFVEANQIVARLDDRVQQIQIESAQHQADARGRYKAAEQTLAKRRKMFDIITELQKSGSTSNSEIERASLELVIAEAKLAEAKEEIVDRGLALKRAKIQLERRWIRAPFSGVVAVIHREEGEFLSPLNPEILTLVKVDQLVAVFNLPSSLFGSLQAGKHVLIALPGGRQVEGTVHAVGIQTEAKSGTIPVKVRIDNRDGTIRSGEQCVLNL